MKSIKGLLSLLLLVAFVTICNGQANVVVPQQLQSYYAKVNTAENFIVTGQLKESLHAYKEAFKVYPQGFSSHYMNAYILAIKLKDKASAQMMASYLIRRGACRDFFNVYPLPLTAEEFNKFFDFNAKDVTANLEYRAALDSLSNKQWEAFEQERSVEALRKVDQENYTSLIKLIEKYGFPDINNLGISCGICVGGFDDLTLSNLLDDFTRDQLKGIDVILTDALVKGQLLNKDFAVLIKQFKNIGNAVYGVDPIYQFNDGYFEDIAYLGIKEKIDTNRLAIGLNTYDEQLEQIRYKHLNPDSPYEIGTVIKMINMDAKSLNVPVKPFKMAKK